LAALSGDPHSGPRFAQAVLTRDIQVKTGLTRFLPAWLHSVSTDVTVKPVTWQGSGDIASASRSNCFLVVPPDRPHLAAGETVTVLLT
jgi:molybdopterin molybdotransferase